MRELNEFEVAAVSGGTSIIVLPLIVVMIPPPAVLVEALKEAQA